MFKFKIISIICFIVFSVSAIAGPPTKLTDGISTNSVTTLGANGDLTLNPAGTGSVLLPDLTANTVIYLDASKKIKSSGVSQTTLALLDIGSSLTSLLAAKAPIASPTFTGTVNIGTTAGPVISSAGGALSSEAQLNISRGGTGQASANSALNAFLPTQSGQSGKYLTTNGTDTSWGSQTAVGLSVVSKTTTYTATTSDDVILASTAGGAYTITLYASSGNSGKVLRFKKTTSDFSVLTIDGNGSETIDGVTTTTLNTFGEEVTLVCDGSNWFVIARVVPKAAGTWTPTFTGLGTVTGITFSYTRFANFLRIKGSWTNGTVSGVNVSLTLPSGLAVDNTIITIVGRGYRSSNSSSAIKEITVFYNTTSSTLLFMSIAGDAVAIGPVDMSLGNAAFATSGAYYITADVPISGWN